MKVVTTLCVILLSSSLGYGETKWWQTMSLYQIYPRSFKDSTGLGDEAVGDLNGTFFYS